MIVQQTYSQQNLNSYGYVLNNENSQFRLNSLESNSSNYSKITDWELSLALRNRNNNGGNLNLIRFSLGKKINDHYLYLRYTPGIKQQFVFSSRTEFLIGDSVQHYNTDLSYTEKFGFGYSLDLTDDFSLGFSMRYFQQKFNEEYPAYFIDTVSQLSIIQIREESVEKNYWRGDIGLRYNLYDNLSLSMTTNNLFILKDFDHEDNVSEFDIRKKSFNINLDKDVNFGIDYSVGKWSISGNYESSKSFILGINRYFLISESTVTIGSLIFHDKNQHPFLAGIFPSVSYSNDLFSVTLSYLKYFSDRSENKTLSQFKKYGIRNIENNYFTSDNINLHLNFALSFKEIQKVRFLDLKTETEIYPTFIENYLDMPIATAKVLNLTDERVSVKPSTLLEELNPEEIYSPIQVINPGDTAEIPFFLIIKNELSSISKSKISQVKFSILTSNSEPDDFQQKTILLHSQNNWDGNVKNLRYFVKRDFDFSNTYSNSILKKNKVNDSDKAEIFLQIKNLFNDFVKDMKYIADRRAAVDYVQFPEETIELKGGDCDDLCVAFSSVLESVGIQTAFIDYKPLNDIGHVALLVNTGLSPSESGKITINDRKYFSRKTYNRNEEIWVPLEVTILTDFDDAWNAGSEKFYREAIDNYGLQKNLVEIVDVY